MMQSSKIIAFLFWPWLALDGLGWPGLGLAGLGWPGLAWAAGLGGGPGLGWANDYCITVFNVYKIFFSKSFKKFPLTKVF